MSFRIDQPITDGPAPESGPMFAVDLSNVELFLELIGDKQIHFDPVYDTIELVPAPTQSNALANELAASMVPFFRHAYWASCQWPKKQASHPWACDACGHYRFQIAQRAKAKCHCGSKVKKRKLEIPWAHANNHNRPPAPWPQGQYIVGNTKRKRT